MRRLMRSAVIAIVAMLLSTVVASAQSPSPAPSAAPSTSPSPSASAFPWPTLPRPEQVPVPAPFEPKGPPTASTTRHGVKVELWLSSPTAAPGEWEQAVVRTTNLGDDAAWAAPGSCATSGTHVQADISGAIPRGVAQTGNAAKFKEKAIRDAGIRIHDFQRWSDVRMGAGTGVGGRALAECGAFWAARKLRPGDRTVERFAWYPAWDFNREEMPLQPLPPGTVSITASWPFVSRGDRPVPVDGVQPRSDDIRVSVPLVTTGDGPGTPSVPDLVDRALADPEWAAWVDKDPTRSTWSYVWMTAWPGPDYPDHPFWAGLVEPNPWGIVTLELIQGELWQVGVRGVIHLDPWTGEVLDVAYE